MVKSRFIAIISVILAVQSVVADVQSQEVVGCQLEQVITQADDTPKEVDSKKLRWFQKSWRKKAIIGSGLLGASMFVGEMCRTSLLRSSRDFFDRIGENVFFSFLGATIGLVSGAALASVGIGIYDTARVSLKGIKRCASRLRRCENVEA